MKEEERKKEKIWKKRIEKRCYINYYNEDCSWELVSPYKYNNTYTGGPFSGSSLIFYTEILPSRDNFARRNGKKR